MLLVRVSAGVASRRDALQLVKSGRVLVDGQPLTAPDASYLIAPTARVTIDGKPFLDPTATAALAASASFDDGAAGAADADEEEDESPPSNSPLRVPTHLSRPRVWLYYKPPGLLVSHKDDDRARKTVFQQLHEDYFADAERLRGIKEAGSAAVGGVAHQTPQPETVDRLLSVGRLDYLSEGLLVLTNSGSIQRFLEHPSAAFRRTYRIKIDGLLTPAQEAELRAGADVDGFQFKPVELTRLTNTSVSSNPDFIPRYAWYELVLTEGKNRELRALLNHCGRSILKLVRVSFHQWGIDMEHMAQQVESNANASGNANAGATKKEEQQPLAKRHVKVTKEKRASGSGGRQTLYGLVPGQLVEIEWPQYLEQQRREWNVKMQQQNAKRSPSPSSLQAAQRAGLESSHQASTSMLAAGKGPDSVLGDDASARLMSHTPFGDSSSAFLTREQEEGGEHKISHGLPVKKPTGETVAAGGGHSPSDPSLPSHIHSVTCGCPGHGGPSTGKRTPAIPSDDQLILSDGSEGGNKESGSEGFLASLDAAISAHRAVNDSLVDTETLADHLGRAHAAPSAGGGHGPPSAISAPSNSKWSLASMLAHNHAFVMGKHYVPYLTDRYPYKKLVVVTWSDAMLQAGYWLDSCFVLRAHFLFFLFSGCTLPLSLSLPAWILV